MSITATEQESNLGKYLLAVTQDIYITQNGKTAAKLVSSYQNKMNLVDSLFDSVPADMTLEEARAEGLKKI